MAVVAMITIGDRDFVVEGGVSERVRQTPTSLYL